MKMGFTGTQQGMTAAQKLALTKLVTFQLRELREFHHGACVGSDEEAHAIVKQARPACRSVAYPSNIHSKRARCLGVDVWHLPKPPLARNADVVNEIELLVAAPKEMYEVLRSGTWATVRLARKKKIAILIIFPNGKIRRVNFTEAYSECSQKSWSV
jgi:hypothetical protein